MYNYNAGEHAQNIALSDKYEIIKEISVSNTPIGALGGALFEFRMPKP